MHCKFLVFLLIVFFFFSFFSSACEFRFIERIGTHGKQNPDIIIIIDSDASEEILVNSLSTNRGSSKSKRTSLLGFSHHLCLFDSR